VSLRSKKGSLRVKIGAVASEINDLLTLRDRLIESRKSLKQPIKELSDAGLKDAAKLIESKCRITLNAIDKEIKQIEKDLDNKINKDSNLKRLFDLATSVPGIGKITTMYMLYCTNEFTLYLNPKQLACYSGIAPFEHTSGSSIRGKTRVSHFANKKLKKLLHLVALSTLNRDKDLSNYYARKTGEGKSKMLVINAIRNKIIHRLCAVMRRGTPYQAEYLFA
jgi:transposase